MSTPTSKNSKVKAGVIHSGGTTSEHTDEQARAKRMANRVSQIGRLTKATDVIAGSDFALRNQPIPKGKEMFPAEWKMQYVDLYYPYSVVKGGDVVPLYIDMPFNSVDIALCKRKQEVMVKAGLRYTYLKPSEGATEGIIRMEGGDPDQIKADQEKLRVRDLEAKA